MARLRYSTQLGDIVFLRPEKTSLVVTQQDISSCWHKTNCRCFARRSIFRDVAFTIALRYHYNDVTMPSLHHLGALNVPCPYDHIAVPRRYPQGHVHYPQLQLKREPWRARRIPLKLWLPGEKADQYKFLTTQDVIMEMLSHLKTAQGHPVSQNLHFDQSRSCSGAPRYSTWRLAAEHIRITCCVLHALLINICCLTHVRYVAVICYSFC